MVTDSNCIYHENHVVMYINITSLFCTFETNRILHANYMPIKRKGLVGTRQIKSGEKPWPVMPLDGSQGSGGTGRIGDLLK